MSEDVELAQPIIIFGESLILRGFMEVSLPKMPNSGVAGRCRFLAAHTKVSERHLTPPKSSFRLTVPPRLGSSLRPDPCPSSAHAALLARNSHALHCFANG